MGNVRHDIALSRNGFTVNQQRWVLPSRIVIDIVVLRVDKWLYYTRFYKTRVLAAKAVNGGHVRINGKKAKPSSTLKAGDVVEIVRNQLPWKLSVTGVPGRRGPAAEARQCFLEDEFVCGQRQRLIDGRKMDRLQMPRTDGRPDKHTRRKLRARRRPD